MDKYTRSAYRQDCTVRIPAVCNFNPETTVLAHLNGAGMGRKHASIHGAYCCSSCHNLLDGRANLPDWLKGQEMEYVMAYIKLAHLEGVIRTQELMIEQGLLKL